MLKKRGDGAGRVEGVGVVMGVLAVMDADAGADAYVGVGGWMVRKGFTERPRLLVLRVNDVMGLLVRFG